MPGKHVLTKPEVQQTIHQMVAAQLPQTVIARAVGVERSTISKYLDRAKPQIAETKHFMEHRADLLARQQAIAQAASSRLVESIAEASPEQFDSLTLEAKARCLVPLMAVQDRAHQQERLERGQSTANIHSLVEQASRRLADIDRELAELDAQS